MSHTPQRKEKDCLNCGTIVQGKFCQNCGQENIEPKETFWHMVTHFFNDITHFDGSFFTTLKDLLFKPGFLSREYMRGRRVSYLHPVRMYVFTSAIFFLLFFTFFATTDDLKVNLGKTATAAERAWYIQLLEGKLEKDTANKWLQKRLLYVKDSTNTLTTADLVNTEPQGGISFSFTGKKFATFKEYDSVQQTISPAERDGWIMRRLMRMDINIKQKFNENPQEATKKFTDSLLHRLPYMLLISLPFFALILKLVYYRRKQFFYADHAVFTIHLYVFTFLLLLLVFSVGKLGDTKGLGDLDFIILVLFLLLFIYLYKAMRRFYGQKRAKTIIKFLLVTIISIIMILVLFLLFMFFSAATL